MGRLFIVAAPSGGGKTSLVKNLTQTLDNIEVSISHTTRSMRPGERDGIDYFFVSQRKFEEMVEAKAFVEHAQVFDHLYGTSSAQINEKLQRGIDVVLDIDWQGAQQIKHLFKDSVSVFILPPSLEVLRERLLKRGRDDDATIDVRMHKAQDEMSHYPEFDYLIVNDEFDHAAADLQAVVVANRLLKERQEKKQAKLLSILLA